MAGPQGKRSVTVVSAVMRPDGLPDFAVTRVAVTPEEFDDGVHYSPVAADLLGPAYEEPFVHFAEGEAPAFLVSAVNAHLAGGGGEPVYHSGQGLSGTSAVRGRCPRSM